MLATFLTFRQSSHAWRGVMNHSWKNWLLFDVFVDDCVDTLISWDFECLIAYLYRTRVRSLDMLVSDWLTHSLTNSYLVNLMDLNDTNCLMMSQQLLKSFSKTEKALQNGGNTSESKVVSENFLHTGQMLISLPTHATEFRRSNWAQNLFLSNPNPIIGNACQ